MSDTTTVLSPPATNEEAGQLNQGQNGGTEQQNSQQQVQNNDSGSGQNQQSKGSESNSEAKNGAPEIQAWQMEKLTKLSAVTGNKFESFDQVEKWVEERKKAESAALPVETQPLFQTLKGLLNKAKTKEEFSQVLSNATRKLTSDYKKLAIENPDSVILDAWQDEMPDVPLDDLKRALSKKYPLVTEDQEPDEQLRSERNKDIIAEKRIEASKLAKSLSQRDQDWIASNAKEETQEDAIANLIKASQPHLQNAFVSGKLSSAKVGDFEYKFDFGTKEKPSASMNLVNEIYQNPLGPKGISRWYDDQGNLDVVKLTNDLLILENHAAIAKAYGAEKASAANEEIEGKITNKSNPGVINRDPQKQGNKNNIWRG